MKKRIISVVLAITMVVGLLQGFPGIDIKKIMASEGAIQAVTDVSDKLATELNELKTKSYPLGDGVGCYSKSAYDNYVAYLDGVQGALDAGTITDANSASIVSSMDTLKNAFVQSLNLEDKDGTVYNAYRDFESDKVGDYFPFGITATAMTNGGKAAIVSEYGNSFLRLTTGSSSGKSTMSYPYVGTVTSSGTQRVVAEVSVRYFEGFRYSNIFLATNQNAKAATALAFDNVNETRKVILKKSSASSSAVKCAEFVYNKWHDLRLVIDVENKVYDLYMDGKLLVTDFPFRTDATDTTNLIGHAFGIDNFANGKIDFDNIKVWIVDEFNEEDFSKPVVSVTKDGIIPGTLENGTLTADSSVDPYSMKLMAPLNVPISLDSHGITISDSTGTKVIQKINGNLYYSSQTVTNNIYTKLTRVDYIKLTQDSSQNRTIRFYDANSNELTGGNIFLSVEDDTVKIATIDMNLISVTTKGTTVIASELVTAEPFSFVCSGKVGDVFDLKELTGYEEFYYGESIDSLIKCTQVKITESGEKAILLPLDRSGNSVNNPVYIVADHLYSFDVPINNIVNEHSEDNGDVYMWKGTDFYVTSNLTPTADDTLQSVTAEETEIKPYTITVTGRIGDTFSVSEFDELLIYAALGDKKEFIMDWINLQKYPSDGGARYYSGYCINNYIMLNSFKDKVNYFVIQDDGNGNGALGISVPGNTVHPVGEADFYTTRGSVVKQLVKQHRDLEHIQLRVPSNIVVEKDGELYTGDFILQKGSGSVTYNGELLINKTVSNISSDGKQQEANIGNWTKNYLYVYEQGDKALVEELFDDQAMIVTVSYTLHGTLTAPSGKQIIYTQEDPFVYTETLSTDKLYQAFYACPNQRGFDVMLDLSAAVKNDPSISGYASTVILTKKWDDGQDYYGIRPDNVTLTLERSGDDGLTWSEFPNNSFVISGEGANAGKSIWTLEVSNIETYYTNANEEIIPYKFRVKSEDYEGKDELYVSTIDGTVVTNSLEMETEEDITIDKTWQNFEGETIYEGVPLITNYIIYQDGKYYGVGSINAREGWTTDVLGLPVYNSDMQKHVYTIYELDESGNPIEDGKIMSTADGYFEHNISDVQGSNQSNQFALVNTFKEQTIITINNDVTKTFIETHDFTDKSTTFVYTLTLRNNGEKVEAISYSDNVEFIESSTQYRFDLSSQEDVNVEVLQGYSVSIEQTVNGKYVTSWRLNEGEWVEGNTAIIETVIEDADISFKNTTTYYGDVEVQGFQMNTNYGEGGVSEKSPSFRVVLRACDKLKNSKGELRDVVSYGTIFALDSEVNSDYVGQMKLDNATKADSDYVYTGDEFKQIYYYECIDGDYFNWTAREVEDPYYNYYALTFVMKSYSYTSLKEPMTFRAYAKLDDGSIVYGTKVYSTRIYDIAENLYKNKKVGTKEGHEFLYRNVLNLVKMEENRVDICYSMLNALQVPNTQDEKYVMINKISKDIVDYVYCQGDYTYLDRQGMDREFVPKRLTNEELQSILQGLNTATSTNHNSLSEWIYNETEKIRNFKGFYKKVGYDWDNSIFDAATNLK